MSTKKTKIDKRTQARRVASFMALERDSERVAEYCRDNFGTTQRQTDDLIKEARAELALAAEIDAREEIGKRREQLEDLLERARDAGDMRVELAAIQELSKLLDLYKTTNYADAALEIESSAAALARAHLEALGITKKGLPIEELARLIANEYVKTEAAYGK